MESSSFACSLYSTAVFCALSSAGALWLLARPPQPPARRARARAPTISAEWVKAASGVRLVMDTPGYGRWEMRSILPVYPEEYLVVGIFARGERRGPKGVGILHLEGKVL